MNFIDLNKKLMLDAADACSRVDVSKKVGGITLRIVELNTLHERLNGQTKNAKALFDNQKADSKVIYIEKDGKPVGITACEINGDRLIIGASYTLNGLDDGQYRNLFYRELPKLAEQNEFASFGPG